MGRFKVFVCFPHLLPVGILCRILSNDFSLFYSCSVINFFYLIRAFLLKEFSFYSADLLLRQYKRCLYHSAFWKKPGTVPQISRCIYPLYVFIPLDIFSQTVHNNGIRNLLEAWLVFLSTDSPELIISLITEYPKFKVMYEHLYYICQNVERMMEMYSAELNWFT